MSRHLQLQRNNGIIFSGFWFRNHKGGLRSGWALNMNLLSGTCSLSDIIPALGCDFMIDTSFYCLCFGLKLHMPQILTYKDVRIKSIASTDTNANGGLACCHGETKKIVKIGINYKLQAFKESHSAKFMSFKLLHNVHKSQI